MKFGDGLWKGKEAFNLHKAFKGLIYAIINRDPDLLEDHIDEILDAPFNEKWAQCEAGDGGMVLNEEFLGSLTYNYLKVIDKFQPASEKEKKFAIRSAQVIMTLYRNDTAYFERIGGTVAYIVNNKDKFLKIQNFDAENSKLLESIFNWWRINDHRLRSRFVITRLFKFTIKRYKTNMFYRRSINMALLFTAKNADKWTDNDEYNPANWFPRKRGKFANALYNWRF